MFDEEKLDTALSSWRSLRVAMEKATEAELKQLLDREKGNLCRPNFLMKVYGRYTVLRAERERREILQGK